MTIADAIGLSSRSDDEAQEQIGASAPGSGVATPRPDPVDKRLPGIMHTFFQQVSSDSTTSPMDITRSPSSRLFRPQFETPVHHPLDSRDDFPFPVMLSQSNTNVSQMEEERLLLNDEEMDSSSESPDPKTPSSDDLLFMSSSSIFVRSSTAKGKMRADIVGGPGLVYTSNMTTAAPTGQTSKLQTRDSRRPPLGRRFTTFSPSNPLQSVATHSSVYASHISNPASPLWGSSISTPVSPLVSTFQHKSTMSLTALRMASMRLTQGARVKDTPPHTPRDTPRGTTSAGSALEGSQSTGMQGGAGLIPGVPTAAPNGQPTPVTSRTGTISQVDPTQTATAAPVGPPKGKLKVKIYEARGMRPSQDSYVVCTFESAEFISRGPQQRRSTSPESQDSGKDGSGALPIAAVEATRSMAIPMKSRQSSNSSIHDLKDSTRENRAVTNPKWDHSATLYVYSN